MIILGSMVLNIAACIHTDAGCDVVPQVVSSELGSGSGIYCYFIYSHVVYRCEVSGCYVTESDVSEGFYHNMVDGRCTRCNDPFIQLSE